MADASDSKSDAGNSVWVQVPSPALVTKEQTKCLLFFALYAEHFPRVLRFIFFHRYFINFKLTDK